MSITSRVLQIVFAVVLFAAAAIGVLLGIAGVAELISQDIVRLSLLGEVVGGFGLAILAGALAIEYARGAFTRSNPPGAA